VGFIEELTKVLPHDLANREEVVAKTARHLELIEEANHNFNLTRIMDPREAAIKHVLDSVVPWDLFASAKHVMDAGTGAGFPGIPLAVVLPGVRFTLAESIQKKARFVEYAIDTLELPNATLTSRRAEEVAGGQSVDIITARALAPLHRALALFAPALKRGTRLLLYKGPDAEREILDSKHEARRRNVRMAIIKRYDLPESHGSRTIIEIQRI